MSTLSSRHPHALPSQGLPRAASLRAVVAHAWRRSWPKAPPKTPVQEAAELRAMAWALPPGEARFAADLLAAADRHERIHEATQFARAG